MIFNSDCNFYYFFVSLFLFYERKIVDLLEKFFMSVEKVSSSSLNECLTSEQFAGFPNLPDTCSEFTIQVSASANLVFN